MSLRESLLNAPKRPLKIVEVDGQQFSLRAPSIAQVEEARKAAGIKIVGGQVSDMNGTRFSAYLLMCCLVDESGPAFQVTDLDVIGEAEVNSTLAKLCTKAVEMANEGAEAGKNSMGPTDNG